MFDFKYDGPGMAKGGTGVLSVDGKEVDSKKIPHTIPALMTIDESFDVGVDTRTERGRQGLPAAVPLHRQARQADHQTRTAIDFERGVKGYSKRLSSANDRRENMSRLRASLKIRARSDVRLGGTAETVWLGTRSILIFDPPCAS